MAQLRILVAALCVLFCYATEQLGWPAPSEETLLSFIGPPLYESRKGMFENHVYPDARGTNKVKGSGSKVITFQLQAKLKDSLVDLDRYFTGIYGASMDGHRSKKADVIQYALTEAQLDPTKEAIIMVGDRNHDILGAQQNGLDSIGVLYGFGEEIELQEAGATFLVQWPKDFVLFCYRNLLI